MQYAGIDISAGQYIADELGMELQVENMLSLIHIWVPLCLSCRSAD